MRKFLIAVLVVLAFASVSYGQGGGVTQVRHGANLPATCDPSEGSIFFLTASNPTIGLYSCNATNTWTLAGSGGGGISVIANQVAVGTGVNTIGSGPNLTWNPATQVFSANTLFNGMLYAGNNGTSSLIQIVTPNALFGISGAATGPAISAIVPSGIQFQMAPSSMTQLCAWQYAGATGYTTLFGCTSGSAALGVAAVAGTPNPILLPTTTGTNGMMLQTDGGSPQNATWTSNVPLLNSTVVLTPLTSGAHWTDKLVTAYGSSQCASGCTIEIPDSVMDSGAATSPSVPSNVAIKFTGSGVPFISCNINIGTFTKVSAVGGAQIRLGGSNCIGLNLTTQSTLQTTDKLTIDKVRIDCFGNATTTGIFLGAGGTQDSTNDTTVTGCTTGMRLDGAQFTYHSNFHAYNNTVGLKVYNNTVNLAGGGGNSNTFEQLISNNNAVGVIVASDANAGLPLANDYFIQPMLLSNSVAGMAIFGPTNTGPGDVYMLGGAPEVNGGGASTVTIDGYLVKKASVYVNLGHFTWRDASVQEASVNPMVFAENSSVVTLDNFAGGNSSGVTGQADATSSFVITNSFAGFGVFQNVTTFPATWKSNPFALQFFMDGVPINTIDSTVPNFYTGNAMTPAFTSTTGTSSNALATDANYGPVNTVTYAASAGSSSSNVVSFGNVLNTAHAYVSDVLVSILAMSSVDCSISVGQSGSTLQAVNFYAGKWKRVVMAAQNYGSGSAFNVLAFPNCTTGPVVSFTRLESIALAHGTMDEQATLGRILSAGAINPNNLSVTPILEAGTGAVVRTVSGKLNDMVSLFDFIPVVDHAAIRACTSTTDEAANIQAAINAVLTKQVTSKHLYAPKGCYAIGSTLAFGNSTTAMASFVFEGDGSWDNYLQAGTAFRWIGAANGTMMQLTAVQNAVFKNFHLDGNGNSPGIGLLVTTLNTAGSNHQNMFDNISVADIPGTPGRAISIDGNALGTNQDVCCSSWSNIHIYPGISSSVVVGVYVNGTQTIEQTFFGNSGISGFTSRGMDFEAGDVRVTSMGTSSGAAGSNVDDFYIAPAADWVSIHDTYTEVNSSTDASTRHVFNFPAGTHSNPTQINGAHIKWNISGGNPIYSAQTGGPFTLENVSIVGPGTGQVFFENAGGTLTTANSPVHWIGNSLSSGINYYVSGNLDMPISPMDRGTKSYTENFPCTSLTSGAIGTNGWTLHTIGVAATAACANNGQADNAIKLTTPSGGADLGHGGVLALDGTGTAIISPSGTTVSAGNPFYDQFYRFELANTTTIGYRVGMMVPNTSTAIPTSGFYIRYDTSIPDTDYMICNDLASVETCFDTGTAAGANVVHTVRFRQVANTTIGVTLYTAAGAVQQISGVDEATVCASGCTFTATPSTTGAVPAMDVVTNANSTAVGGYLLGWRAAVYGLTQ